MNADDFFFFLSNQLKRRSTFSIGEAVDCGIF